MSDLLFVSPDRKVRRFDAVRAQDRADLSPVFDSMDDCLGQRTPAHDAHDAHGAAAP
jgi:hypothetical protein